MTCDYKFVNDEMFKIASEYLLYANSLVTLGEILKHSRRDQYSNIWYV